MKAEKSAPVFAEHGIDIDAPIETVWQRMLAVDQWPSWNPAVKRARLEGAPDVGSTFTWSSGGVRIVSRMERVLSAEQLVWSGKAIGTRAIHEWSFVRRDGSVHVTTRESFDGWLVRLFRTAMQQMVDESLVAWLTALKRSCEA